jgi:Dolichyl-phosphate-mannose-protein mannosyltransferase
MSEPLTTHHSPLTNRTDWLLIGALLLLVLPLRLWLLHNTEVTARDSIGYIRYALQFDKHPWNEVVKKNDQHPGYPAMVWLVSIPVRNIDGTVTPENMELCTQLVNLVASLLLIVPMYLLGRQFFDRTTSFWATLLYQYLPISAQLLSDGISEPMYLVLLVSGLLQAVHAIRDKSVWRCALCGVFTGLAYLTRPEGALILPALAVALVGMQLRSGERMAWSRFLACGSIALLAAMLIGAVYVGATGRISNKPSLNETLRNLWELATRFFLTSDTQAAAGSVHLFGASFPLADSRWIRLERSVWALISEINQGFHYVAGMVAVIGGCLSFKLLWRDACFLVLLAFGVLHSLVLIALAMSVGYVSDRHVMILVLIGCFLVIVGLREVPRIFLAWRKPSQTPNTPANSWKVWLRSPCVWFAVLMTALLVFCMPKATQRLHGNRAANHAAGMWLAEHLEEGDLVIDDHSWSNFFAGHVFLEGNEPVLPRRKQPTCYVVTTRSRDPLIDEKRQDGVVEKDAKVAWSDAGQIERARVIIYAQPRDAKKNPWRKAVD